MSWAAVAAAGVGVAGGLASRGGGGSTQSTQSSAPWENSQAYLQEIMQRGANQIGSDPNGLGAQSPYTLQAQGLLANRALGGNPLNQAAQAENLKTIQGGYTDLSQNPAAQNAMGMAKSQINGQFSGDNYGNSAHQEWLGRGLMSAAAPFYESERQRQMGATALAPSLANQDYTDLSQLGAVGGMQDQRAQAVKDAPWNQIFKYQQAVSGTSGGQTTTQTPYFTNPAASALGGGMAGLGLYNGMRQGGLLGGNNWGGMGSNPSPNFGGQNLAQQDFGGGYYG